MLSKNQLLLNILKEGTTPISNLLLSNYQRIGLTDQEMLLVIHLLYYQSKGQSFPSITELEKRMTINSEEIMKLLQRLVRQGYIYIEENNEKETGKLSEIYNLTPIYLKLINELERDFEVTEIKKEKKKTEQREKNIFVTFEQEFGRPLSPMEIELINTWIDNDKYNTEIIIYALKEAVYANKLNFRYIDRILFEWQKKNIRTVDQIKEHIKKFRNNQEFGKGGTASQEGKVDNNFEFYNWLEND